MKPGRRALGVAFSDASEVSTVAGAVVRADRVVDGFSFSACTVGGTGATETVAALVADLDRPDVRYLFCAGVAPAWFNLLDLHRLHEDTGRPVIAVSFESSPGLGDAIREAFSGEARDRRLAVYESLPPRHERRVNDERVFVRAVGLDVAEATRVLDAYTPEGGRPEPLRVARLAARAAREYRTATSGN